MISEKLRSFRLENGLNQEQLAEKIGSVVKPFPTGKMIGEFLISIA